MNAQKKWVKFVAITIAGIMIVSSLVMAIII